MLSFLCTFYAGLGLALKKQTPTPGFVSGISDSRNPSFAQSELQGTGILQITNADARICIGNLRFPEPLVRSERTSGNRDTANNKRRRPDLNRDIQRKPAFEASAVPDCATSAILLISYHLALTNGTWVNFPKFLSLRSFPKAAKSWHVPDCATSASSVFNCPSAKTGSCTGDPMPQTGFEPVSRPVFLREDARENPVFPLSRGPDDWPDYTIGACNSWRMKMMGSGGFEPPTIRLPTSNALEVPRRSLDKSRMLYQAEL